MEKMLNVKINGVAYQVPAGSTVLEACAVAGIKIPTLCYLKDINPIGACRVCVVEVKGARSLVASCVYPANEGMEIITNSKKVLESRKTTVELLLSNHEKKCLSCVRSKNCELQTLSEELMCNAGKFSGEMSESEVDETTPYLVRDNNKCILCRRCVAACKNYQGISVIGCNARGFDTHVGTAFEKNLKDTPCVGCGQCINVCPTAALREKDEINEVLSALADPNKRVICGTAPAVRVGLGEEFGIPMGTNVEGKMVSALRKIGFNDVFDVNFTADLTIMEEGTEFINRVKKGGTLPMLTSCSPAWIKFVEHYYPEFIPNLSSCKSPQQMLGALCKTYYAEKLKVKPENIYFVSIMPCTAKKFEKTRDNQNAGGVPDVDAVLTTRELARLIRLQGIEFNLLKDEAFDAPMGIFSGAGLIFGATGGVMEAALRTLYEILEKKELDKLDFTAVRGTKGIKEASLTIGGIAVKVAVASGLANAGALLNKIKSGKANYHFIEIMSCPGGCVNGGGQPIKTAHERNTVDIRTKRAQAIYKSDKAMKLRKSHENPAVKELYKDYLGEIGGNKAHKILHTKYQQRPKY
ncbi:MAG: NADH-dependent [FeFe] hydrogenase, group A6 [Firmicutes bacterium]|nr:NADH-dependent [FeFe] hydrogenase, group A6 [Bacillota bacterium]